ncbi:hypothetical protein [Atlanticothrix silvestris]|uniref:hypothetical protein n=1 Tax=Atlanticothrix silvestris TaxID=2840444 RepID=UPI001BDDA712|nr:hypothetical protein [Atlanticothrix silvestris]
MVTQRHPTRFNRLDSKSPQNQYDPILKVLHTPVTNRFTAAIAYSLLFGFAIGILIWAGDKLWQSHKRKRQQ